MRAQQLRLAATPGVMPLTVELAYGDAPFHVTTPDDARHLQLRLPTAAAMWHKEALINAGVTQLLPPDWSAVAFVDAEVVFENNDWAVSSRRALLAGTVDALQPYSSVTQHGGEFSLTSLAAEVARGGHFQRKYLGDARNAGACGGFAWVLSRLAWDRLNGLHPYAIIGTGDMLLAAALFRNTSVLRRVFPPDSAARTLAAQWYAGAARQPALRVGFVEGHLKHEDHGSFVNRRYIDRQALLADLDPTRHLRLNADGLPVPTADMPHALLLSVQRYFATRDEDSK